MSDPHKPVSNIMQFKYSCDKLSIQRKPSAIIFNFNCIFKDFLKIDQEAINHVLTKHGLPSINNVSCQKDENKKAKRYILSQLFDSKIFTEAYEEYNQYLISIIDRFAIIEHAIEFLNFCKKNSIKTVMLANQSQPFINTILEKHKINTYFDLLLTTTDPEPKILLSSIESLNLKLRENTLIMLIDSIEDVYFSFRNNLCPVLISEENDHFITESELSIIEKVNFDNPLRVFKKFDDLKEIIERSQNIKSDIVKISYIGAGGKIGHEAIPLICEIIPENVEVELVLIGSGTDSSICRLRGLCEDVKGSINCSTSKVNSVKFVISNEYTEITNSKIVICSAGKWPTEEIALKFKKIDPSGRNKQSFANKEMIEEISQKVQQFAPDCLFVLTTNQVDVMCEVARSKAPNLNIIGLTGLVDSSRLKQTIKDEMNLNANGFMIGYHNSSMMPLISSLKVGDNLMFPYLAKDELNDLNEIELELKSIEKVKLNEIIEKIKKMGSFISNMQKTGTNSNKDTGSSILPAKALAKIVAAFCFDEKMTESFNTFIKDKIVADHYGVPLNTALSIPLKIEKNKITQITDIPVLQYEKVKLREEQENLKKDIQILMNGNLAFFD